MIDKIGLVPGSAVYTGDVKQQAPTIRVISYTEKEIIQHNSLSVKELKQYIATCNDKISWIHIEPISSEEDISSIGESLTIHPMIIEDILSISQRPKVEELDDYTFVIMQCPSYKNDELIFSQISFILTKEYVVCFADFTNDRFEAIKKRLEKDGSRIRKENSAYLLFAFMDYIIDSYFLALEKIGDEIENLEDEIINNPTKNSIEHIHRLKRTLMQMKKNIWPIRELINTLMRSDNIDAKYLVYFRDIYDHVINIVDIIEGQRDTTASFLDIYLSTLSNRMNEIMKTLSLVGAIFIPLSFITGYFGMNFAAEGEGILKADHSFMWTNISMLLIPIGFMIYFKIRKWF